MSFVHLHTRSEYSFLLSTITLEKLVTQAHAYQMPGIALTDIGCLHGAIEFFSLVKKLPTLKNGSEFNPIIGMTVNMTPISRSSHQEKLFQLVLIAENMEGYRNLCQLSTISHNRLIPNNHQSLHLDLVQIGKPYTNLEEILQYSRGCIVLTSWNQGELFNLILNNLYEESINFLRLLSDGFGRDNIFIEIQNHNYDEEKIVSQALPEIAAKVDLPIVATNQVSYLHENDRLSWDIFYSIGDKKNLIVENNQVKPGQIQTLPGSGYYLRSPQEMEMIFTHLPQALQNTLVINKRCRVNIIEEERHMPFFPLEGKTPGQYLRDEAHRRLKEKCPSDPKYTNRLDYELSVIEKMDFASYFIIVADLINYARSQNIMVGTGRGSAAGSLISYVMGITSLDPIVYGLYFERFLNPERISFPDIDIDFQDDRRDEVIEYVRERYGREHVAHIVSFSKLKSKAIFKDVARVFGIDFETTNKISKLIKTKLTDEEDEKRAGASYLEFNYHHNNDFASIVNSNQIFRVIYEHSLKLENLTRQTSIHPAGIVIADKPLVQYVPLIKANDGNWATQFDGSYLESHCGLLKIDFLGIVTLTVLQKCVDDVKRLKNEAINIDHPPLQDKKAFSIFSQGLTAGIFQFESPGMTAYLKELMPDDLKELTAMNALYRPGPMAWIPVYIAKKHNRAPYFVSDKAKRDFNRLEEICDRHQGLNEVLSETRGIPFYQEQIMEICKIYASFTLGAADNVRKAMGKKDKNLIQRLRKDFIEGATKNNHPKDDAEFLYDEIIIPFAGYGFNKSHSACYAYLAYQTAYLKAHYPTLFMISLLNSELSRSDTQKAISKYLNECFFMDIEVYPPDINNSSATFISQKNHIIYGLAGIKNIGFSASKAIVKEREAHGPYQDPIDFLLRHSSEKVGKQIAEALIKAGCFNFTGYSSERWFSILGEIQKRLEEQRVHRQFGQMNLFQESGIDFNIDLYAKIKNTTDNRSEAVRLEKEILGFNLRYEPTILYRQQIQRATDLDISISTSRDRIGHLGAVIKEISLFQDRNGKDMARLIINDGKQKHTVICFNGNWKKVKQKLPEAIREKDNLEISTWLTDKVVRLKLLVRSDRNNSDQTNLILDGLDCLDEEVQDIPKTVWIRLTSHQLFNDNSLTNLKKVIENNPGPYPVRLVMVEKRGDRSITLKKRVKDTPTFKLDISQIDIVESIKVIEEVID